MVKKLVLALLLTHFLFAVNLIAQNDVDIKGVVLDKKTNEPVLFCVIHIKELEKWTTTDEHGTFVFTDVQARSYTIETQCLGYEKFSVKFNLAEYTTKPLKLIISPTSFDMEEIVVVAQKGKDVNTSTQISSAAIEHIQPTSLGDIMQLMPGYTATNPDLSNPQQLSIREIGNDDNSALGTAIIIDDAPISNDGNLQSLSTATGSDGEATTVAGTGVDLRKIPTENIESIEVIKGIPSVVYGDLTSGAVVIKTKAGRTPLSVKLKTDPKIKHFSIGKGLTFIKSNSSLNFNLEYLNSYRDVRSKYEGFSRLTGDVLWSKTFFKDSKPLSLNTKFSYYRTMDEKKTDPDALVLDEEYYSKERGVRFNVHGRWQLNSKLLSNIKYSFSYSTTHQENYQKRYRSTGGLTALSLATTEGENIGMYLPNEQLTEMTIDGKPVNFYGQITARKVNHFNNDAINTFLLGVEYRYSKNNGDGQIFDPTNPPYVTNKTARPRSFKDIPSMRTLSMYIEDKIILPIGTTQLTLQAGARLNNYQADGLFKSDLGHFLEPRANLQYNILNKKNNSVFGLLSLNVGVGKTYKAPSMIYLYPDKAYRDLKMLDWYTGDPATNMVVFDTRIFDTDNPDLQPSESLKKEIGIDFAIGKIKGNVTAFKEEMTNGFFFERQYVSVNYDTYNSDDIPIGTLPDLNNVSKENHDYFISYLVPKNFRRSDKTGIEFDLRLGKIKSLYTSFTIDGAWFRTKRVFNENETYYLPSSVSSRQYEYIGVYPAGESRVNERFNTNLRMVTHVPDLRLIVTTTLQMIWFNKYYYPFYDEAPMYLVDKDGNTMPFTEEMRTDPLWVRYVDEKTDRYWETETMSPLFMANIRVSKEISDNMRLSLYVNNFTNYRPLYQYTRSLSYIRRNPSIYFGAELRIKI